MCVIYIVEQNVKVSSSCVYHRLYFTHKLKNPIIKPHRKISKEPAVNCSSGFWRHSSPTLLRQSTFKPRPHPNPTLSIDFVLLEAASLSFLTCNKKQNNA